MCNNSCAITKSWNPESCSTRSAASVMVPEVEQEPHFRVMRCTRTRRGLTFSRSAQYSTRWRTTSRGLSRRRIGSIVEQDRKNDVDDAPTVFLSKIKEWPVEGRSQLAVFVGIDRRVRETGEQELRLGRKFLGRNPRIPNRLIVLECPEDAECPRRQTAVPGCLDGLFLRARATPAPRPPTADR